MPEEDPQTREELDAITSEYVPLLFAFRWRDPERRRILITELWRGDHRLVPMRGAGDVGDEGDAGSPAVFSAGHAKPGARLKFKWAVWLLDDISVMEAYIKVGDSWTKLKPMESPGRDKKWSDVAELTIPFGGGS